MTELAQALFSYDSAASRTDPHLRDIAWRRENAVLALGTAASLAQLTFARTLRPGAKMILGARRERGTCQTVAFRVRS